MCKPPAPDAGTEARCGKRKPLSTKAEGGSGGRDGKILSRFGREANSDYERALCSQLELNLLSASPSLAFESWNEEMDLLSPRY